MFYKHFCFINILLLIFVMDKEILRKVILNHNEIFNNKDVGITRNCLKQFKKLTENPIAIVITGHRRAGKSTLLLQIAKTFYKNDFYYVDFSDPSLNRLTEMDYEPMYELFLKEFGEKKAFFFDEIQGKPEWNKFINNLRERGHKCFVTGSNAELLSSEISTFLTGRHINVNLFPFSFLEFLNYKNIEYKTLSTKNTAIILKQFDIYLKKGGFPEIILYNQLDLLKEIYKDIITKDIIVRWNLKQTTDLDSLYYYLISNTTQEFTYTSLKQKTNIKDLKTIKNYVSYITKTYMLYEVKQFDYSLKKQRKKIKKIYCIDNGFLSQVGYAFFIGDTRYLENIVFIELKRRNKEVYFYRDNINLECDFVIVDKKKITELIQVCYNLTEENKEREINGLLSAMKKYRLKEGLLLTYNTQETITINNYKIKVVPVWKYLLENDI